MMIARSTCPPKPNAITISGVRLPYVVNIDSLPGEPRPRYTITPGVAAMVRLPSAATGLTRMGVHVRQIEPGFAGTNRHFHTAEEEWVYVLAGSGIVRIGPLRIEVRQGHFVGFPTGPRPHHFLATKGARLILLEGGERRPAEDACWYPDARMLSRGRLKVEPYEEPPAEEADERQVLHVDNAHAVHADAAYELRNLDRPTGLQRQRVSWLRMEPQKHFTAFSQDIGVDDWLFVLAGRGRVIDGEHAFAIAAKDFVGHPAGLAPWVIAADDHLTLLIGGQAVSKP
jgi:uncharacterized cupin superfamily protein